MTAPLSAIQVIDSMGRGGAEQALATILPALRAEGVVCQVAVCGEPYDIVPPLQGDGFVVERLGMGSRVALPFAAARLAAMIQRTKARIVHAHLFNAELVTAVAALLPSRSSPIRVVTFHNLAYDMHPPTRMKQRLHRSLERAIIKGFFDRRIAVSRASSAHYAEHLGIDPPEVMPVAISDELFSHPRPEPRDTEPPIIFMPARMSREKGHFVILDAARILMDRGVRFSLVMAGHGPLRGNVQHRLEQLGLGGHARVVPSMPHEEVIDFMRGARLVAIPSLSEGLPLVAIEAMALGVPVVASRAGGLAELIVDNVTGISVPVEDAPAFADGLQAFLTDATLWRRVSESARDFAAQRYAASSVGRALSNFYRASLGEAT